MPERARRLRKRAVLEPLLVLLSPFAPHIAEELWHELGHEGTIFDERYPVFDPACLVENSFDYPVSVNGKMRFKKEFPLGAAVSEIEAAVLADPQMEKYTAGKEVRKVIVVPGKIINVVV